MFRGPFSFFPPLADEFFVALLDRGDAVFNGGMIDRKKYLVKALLVDGHPVPIRQQERDAWELAKAMLIYAHRKASQ
jgi:hypothetical protein